MIAPNSEHLLRSWGDEIASKCNRVRNLIGDRHWLSDGKHKEQLILSHLQRYTGAGWRIGSGFVIALAGELVSPELDIHVSSAEVPPLLNDGDVQIIGAEGLAAYFEIKSTLTSSTLDQVLSHQKEVLEVLKGVQSPIWCGAIFFRSELSSKSLNETLVRHFRSMRDESLLDRNRRFCVASLDREISFLEDSDSQGRLHIKNFEVASLSVPLAICDLLDFLAQRPHGLSQETTINQFAEAVDTPTVRIFEVE